MKNLKLVAIFALLFAFAFGEAYSASAPTVQARYLSFTNITSTTARLSWINGNGAKRVVVGTTNSMINWATVAANLSTTAEYTDADGNWNNKVEVGTTGAYVVDVLSGSNRVTNLSNLSPNSTYYFFVFEYNATPPPIAYNTVTVVPNNPKTLETGILPPTTLATSNATQNSIQISFVDPNSPQASSYRLDVSTTNTFATFVTGYNNLTISGSPFTITGLSPETQYYFRLRAVDGSKISSNSDTVGFKTGATPPTLTAGGPTTLCGGGSVDLSYTVGNPNYTYTWYKDGNSFTHSGTTYTATTSGSYQVSVTTLDNIETFSNSIVVTINPIPAAPTAGSNTYTYDGTFKTATATPPMGATLVWYDAPTGGNVISAPSQKNAGTYTAWVASLQNGCESATRTEVTLTINPLALNFNAVANNKAYNATTAATGSINLLNVVAGDVVSATGTFTFDNKNVGTGKTVNVTGITLSGADAANYTIVSSTTTTADISPASLTLNLTPNNKVYDGTTAATGTITLSGVFAGDDVNVTGTFAFSDKNVGNNKTVTASGITLSGADAGNYLTPTPYNTTADITPLLLSLTVTANNKQYDATTAATGTITLNNAITGDAVAATATFAFLDKNVGTGKTVNVTGIALTGADAGNYTLPYTSTTATADITAVALTVNATANNKTYDGTTDATGTLSLTGVLVGDVVNITGGTFTFNNKNVGTNKPVTVTGYSLTGADAGNYTVPASVNTTANISALGLTFTLSANNKTYNGTTAATGTITLNGVISGDVVSATGTFAFADKNVGTGKTVNVTGIALTGADAGNYTVANSGSTTADITPLLLSLTVTANNKQYDATTAATGTITLNNAITGDAVAATATFAFLDKNVGTGKTVNVTGIALTGADAGNYTLPYTSTTATADITAVALTVNATANNKTYDGTTDATGTLSLTGVLVGDVVNITGGTFTFNNKNVGTNKPVTVTGYSLTGADAGNYTVPASVNTTANISALGLTFTLSANNKTYNGTTAATGTITLNGVISGDVVSATGTFAFADKNAGNGKTVNVTGIALTGADAGNYTVANSGSTTANIIPLALTYTISANNKVYDGTTAGSGTITLTNVITGDNVTANGTFTFASANVGTGITVTVSSITLSGADASNYTITPSAITSANITPLVITVTANAQTKVYGSADPALTYTYTPSLIGGDQFSGALSRQLGENVGTYTITQGSLSLPGNYSITYNSANLTITPKTLTVTADNKSKCQGDPNPALTITYSGFEFSDGPSSLTTEPTASTTATQSSPAGTYTISVSGGVATNYTFNYVNGTLTINPLPTVGTQPTDQTASNGGSATFNAVINDADSYQWYESTDGVTFSPISGATNQSLTLNPVSLSMDGYKYKLVATNACGTVETNVVTLYVLPTPPSTQATNIVFNTWSRTSITLSWTRGNGDACLVVARQSANLDPVAPTNGTSYNANSVFGSGDLTGTGSYVVYKGTGTTVTVTGLQKNTDYRFQVFEYNGSGATSMYNTNTATNNPRTRKTLNKDVFEFADEANTFAVSEVAPNPVRETINFTINAEFEGNYTAELYSITGERLFAFNYNLNAGNHNIIIPVDWKLPNGIYTLRIANDKESVVRKVTVVQ